MQLSIRRTLALFLGMAGISAQLALYPAEGNSAYAGPSGALIGQTQLPGIDLIKAADTTQLTDGEIAYVYLQANLFEVQTAELARTLGTSGDVKQHGEMVEKDHRGVIKMFERLLEMNHIKPVETSNSAATIAQHQALMTNLKSQTGSGFDKAYLAYELKNHRAVIDAIRNTLLPAVRNPAVAGHLKEVLPAFEHHLAVTLDAARKVGVSDTN